MIDCLLSVFFFFFKQKTAYEMRISDWSSDVCSSDLVFPLIVILFGHALLEILHALGNIAHQARKAATTQQQNRHHGEYQQMDRAKTTHDSSPKRRSYLGSRPASGNGRDCPPKAAGRSEERRVGKACVRTCRSRGAPYH